MQRTDNELRHKMESQLEIPPASSYHLGSRVYMTTAMQNRVEQLRIDPKMTREQFVTSVGVLLWYRLND